MCVWFNVYVWKCSIMYVQCDVMCMCYLMWHMCNLCAIYDGSVCLMWCDECAMLYDVCVHVMLCVIWSACMWDVQCVGNVIRACVICVSNILYVYIPCNMRVVRCEVCNVRCACVVCLQYWVYANVMCEICAICATWFIYVWCVYVSNVMWCVYACCNVFEMISVNARYDVYVWCSIMWECYVCNAISYACIFDEMWE